MTSYAARLAHDSEALSAIQSKMEAPDATDARLALSVLSGDWTRADETLERAIEESPYGNVTCCICFKF